MDFAEAIKELERLRQLITAGADDSVFTNKDRNIIDLINKEEYGKPLQACGCRNLYTDAVILLHRRLKTRGKMKKEAKYILKAGVLIRIGTEYYSRHNITDEIAREYLKKFPGSAWKFEKMPTTKDEDPENEEKKPENEAETGPVTQNNPPKVQEEEKTKSEPKSAKNGSKSAKSEPKTAENGPNPTEIAEKDEKLPKNGEEFPEGGEKFPGNEAEISKD